MSLSGILLSRNAPSDTAGLKCPPETRPTVYNPTTRARPKANAIATRSPPPVTMTVPVPISTSTNVPYASAAYFCQLAMQELLSLSSRPASTDGPEAAATPCRGRRAHYAEMWSAGETRSGVVTDFYYFCGHEQWQPETLVRHAVIAEEAGFDGLVVSEHFHPWVDDHSAAGFAFATIAAMAQATSRVRLITGVTTPLFRYHPGVVAQAAATLDRLSAGRFDLGVGTGENINEGPLGYPFPGYAERAGRMREALQIMRRLLAGEKLTFEGEWDRPHRAKLYSPPLHRMELWMGGGGGGGGPPRGGPARAEHNRPPGPAARPP